MKLNSEIYKQLALDQFVVFDIETTGLSPEKDEIIEIAMVRLKNGEITETYEQIFDPEKNIPEFITTLTGITNTDCSGKPLLKEKIYEILEFFGDDFIVAHNTDFDFSFLNYDIKNYISAEKRITDDRIIDSLDLSRFLLFDLPNHKLITIAEYFDLVPVSEHRAIADAKTCTKIFLRLMELIVEVDRDLIGICCELLKNTNLGIEIFFQKLYSYQKKAAQRKDIVPGNGPDNIIGEMKEKAEQDSCKKIKPETLEHFFHPKGYLADHLQSYEYRKQQYEMADSVRKAFNQNGFLLAEAGTGIGKSIAYLIPAVLWVQENHASKIVISTNTKNLQNQLFYKDLPILEKIPGIKFLAVLLKGRGNYLCRRAWDDLIEHPERISKKDRKQVLPLVVWAQKTITGDIEENSGFSQKRNNYIWKYLSCERSNCSGNNCQYDSSCFLNRVRKIVPFTDIIVVNHSLLFSDIAAGNSILKLYDTLIIDEAHNIESSATNSFKSELNVWKFHEVLKAFFQENPYKTGLLYFMQENVQKVLENTHDQTTIINIIRTLIRKVEKLRENSLEFFRDLKNKNFHLFKSGQKYAQVRFTSKQQLFGELEAKIKKILTDLTHFEKDFVHLQEQVGDMKPASEKEYYRWIRELDFASSKLEELVNLVDYFINCDYKKNIIWSVLINSKKSSEMSLNSVPLNISKILESGLFSHIDRSVLTSATLQVNDSFDYFIKRVGLSDFDTDRIITADFGSPFNYSEQTMFMIPSYLSDPREPDFIKEVSQLLLQTFEKSAYGTMVLFTSYKMLRQVYFSLLPLFKARNIQLLGQGIDGSRSSLLKIFKENRNSILFGTNSFWEGIDIPGSALEILIITKIPFQVPTEPIFQARMEKVNKESGNGFLNYAVPEAVIRLRQGIGRLIRSTEDRGVVLLLDQRLIKTRYGGHFTRSFPIEPIICSKEDLLQKKLQGWF